MMHVQDQCSPLELLYRALLHSLLAPIMSIQRSSAYVKGNDVRYGLKVAHRHQSTEKVIGLQCRFCIVFGHEEKVGSKRKPATTVQEWNAPFWYDKHWESCSGPASFSMGTVLLIPFLKRMQLLMTSRCVPKLDQVSLCIWVFGCWASISVWYWDGHCGYHCGWYDVQSNRWTWWQQWRERSDWILNLVARLNFKLYLTIALQQWQQQEIEYFCCSSGLIRKRRMRIIPIQWPFQRQNHSFWFGWSIRVLWDIILHAIKYYWLHTRWFWPFLVCVHVRDKM